MNGITEDGVDWSRNDVFQALAHGRRRAALRVLDRVARVRPSELAVHLVAAETDEPLMDVTRQQAERVQADLEHVHLPKLADAGLVTRADGVVRTTRHPALQDPKIEAMIETEAPDWDDVLDALADKHRRIVLTTLYRTDERMSPTDIAIEVAETVRGDGDAAVSVEAVLRDLHHVHLPKLAAAGLVAYDADEETVTYEGHPALDEEWLVVGIDDTPRAIPLVAHE